MAPDPRSQSVKANIHWHEAWMAVTDGNGDVVGEWCTYADPESARCVWCCVNFLYKSQGISGIKKHALGSGHKKIADGRKGRIVAQP